MKPVSLLVANLLALAAAGCGLTVPVNHPLQDNSIQSSGHTAEGDYTTKIVEHVLCEISDGLVSSQRLGLPWLNKWGTTVTQSITMEDQSGISPGITIIQPLQNVIRPFASGGNLLLAQTKSQSIGVSGSANALSTETLQYTYRNIDILTHADKTSCVKNGFFLDGDLRIKDFIYDNATIAAGGTVAFAGGAGKSWERPIFNVFTEEVTFVAAFGGSFTPTWKLATIQANASSNLLIAERTNTNDLVITLGPLDPKQSKDAPVQLTQAAQSQHLTRVQASAIAVSIQGQSH